MDGAIIGIVGTAPIGAVNELTVCQITKDFAQFGVILNQGYTLPDAFDVLARYSAGKVYVVNVLDPAKYKTDVLVLHLNATPKNKRMTKECKTELVKIIQNFDGYKDLNCLASWLLFSGQQVATLEELFQHDFWHCIRQSDYTTADGYLSANSDVGAFFAVWFAVF